MDMKNAMLQALDMQKTYFDNAYMVVEAVQDETHKALETFISHVPWIPSEGKTMMFECFSAFKKNRDDIKKAVDDGYTHIGGYIRSSLREHQGV